MFAAVTAAPAGAGSGLERAKQLSPFGLQGGTTHFRDAVLTTRGARTPAAQTARWGGAVSARTGEAVTIYVSASYAVDPAVAQHAADFVASLYHGAELRTASFYLAPRDEIGRLCGEDTSGCYFASQNLIVAPAADLPDGTSAETVLAHEYGHLVAASESNAPWRSLDWGTKRWATHERVCSRTQRHTAYPGDSGEHYAVNPGEAFAETYRLLNYRHLALAGWKPTAWVLDRSFYPDAGALDAVREDVLDPWQGTVAKTWSAVLARPAPSKRVDRPARASRTVQTPLDGTLEVTLDHAPAGSTVAVLDVSGNILARSATGSLQYAVCGQRTLTVVVTAAATGDLVATISVP
jgi:hypothetical protein